MPVAEVKPAEPQQIFLSQWDSITAQMNAETKSILDEVEDEKPAESAVPAPGSAADETVLEAKEPEVGNHPEWLVDRAIELTDLTSDEVLEMTTAELSSAVKAADLAAKRLQAERLAAQVPAPASDKSEAQFDPALYDKDDPFVKNAMAQAEELKQLKVQVAELRQVHQVSAKNTVYEKLDALFNAAPPELAAIVGKGTRGQLKQTSKEMQARGQITQTMEGLNAAFKGTKSMDELFQMAVQANYAGKLKPAAPVESPAPTEAEAELTRRKAVFDGIDKGAAKPTNREREDPPGEAKARAVVREKLREIRANTKDDEEFDSYFQPKAK